MLPRSGWRAALALLVALATSVQAADRLQDFALQIPMRVEGEGPWYRLQVPMHVQLASRHADLRDLRVFDAEGETLAYALIAGQALRERTLTTHTARGFPLYAQNERGAPSVDVRVQRDAHGTLVEVNTREPDAEPPPDAARRGWLLDGSAIHAPLERLVLDWPDTEGFQRFTIEASDDLQQWRSWGEGRVTRLSFDGERVEQREVRLPGQKARYLRLLWQSPAQAPELRTAQLLSTATTRRPAPLIWSQPMPARQTGENEYVWELPLTLPIERLRIPLDRTNLLLPVSLQARSDGAHKWRPLMRGLLYRVTQQDKELMQDELDLPGRSQVRQLRLRVDPRGGGFAGQQPHLLFGMRSTELVFLVRDSGPLLLAVGKAGVQSAELPLATLMPGAQDKDLYNLPEATLTTTGGDPEPAAPTSRRDKRPDWNKIGLWAVLLGGVTVLILMAWGLLRPRKPDSE